MRESIGIRPGIFAEPPGAKPRFIPINENESEKTNAALLKVYIEAKGFFFAYPKPDGWRIQLHKNSDKVHLFTREGIDVTDKFSSFARQLKESSSSGDFVLDIELVGFDQYGTPIRSKGLSHAHKFRGFILDMLWADGRNMCDLPTFERIPLAWHLFKNGIPGLLDFAEFSFISKEEQWLTHAKTSFSRYPEGFDGDIIKGLDTSYFTDVIKVKNEIDLDVVIIGAYFDGGQNVEAFLGALFDEGTGQWIPALKIIEQTSDKGEWTEVLSALSGKFVVKRPPNVEWVKDLPSVWLEPSVVIKVVVQQREPTQKYLVGVDLLVRNWTMRYDKAPSLATTMVQAMEVLGDFQKPSIYQLSFL